MNDHPNASTVAVVDDDPSVLRSLEYLLESADYAVQLFASAAALLDGDAMSKIDCLITDIDMPGIDGFELLRLVRAARPDLPVIVITGYPDTLNRLPLANDGDPRCFVKPFRGPELLAAVSDALLESNRRSLDGR